MPSKLMPYLILWGVVGSVLGALVTYGAVRLGFPAVDGWHVPEIAGGVGLVIAAVRGYVRGME